MKKELMIVMVVAMLVMTACGTSQGNASNRKAFIGGTQGVQLSFLPGEPPAEVTSADYPFSATVELKNKGEWTVPMGSVKVMLKGFDAQDFGTTQDALTKSPDADLEKNSINPDSGEVLEGSAAYATFDLKYSATLTGNHEFPFVVDVCYPYKTFSTGELCIKKNLLDSTTDTSVCSVSGPRSLQNSGAPVQISQFIEYTAGKTAVRFTVTVSKVGQGDVSRTGTSCSTLNLDKDIVHVKLATGIEGALTCSALAGGSEGDVKLINGVKQIQCTQQVSAGDLVDKIQLLDGELTYDYLDTIQTKVLVKQVTSDTPAAP
jgi:hypothetical protein